MTGSEVASLLRPVVAVLKGRGEVTPDEALTMIAFALGVETIGMKRARSGRSGGIASAGVRRDATGTAQPKQTLFAPEASPEAKLSLLPKQAPKQVRSKLNFASDSKPLPSSPPSPPSDSQSPDLPKAFADESKEPVPFPASSSASASANDVPRDWAKRPPTSLDEAREMPLFERAQLVQQRPDQAQWLQPEQWAEVRLAIVAFRSATNQPRLAVGSYAADSGVRRLVELYASGMTPDEVCNAIPQIVASPWWTRDGSSRGLSSLTLEVLRRELAVPRVGAVGRGILEQFEASGQRGGTPETIGASVRRVAGGKT